MNKYKCIIFDCDGVLVDSERLGMEVLVGMANSLGAEMSVEESLISLKGKSFQICMDTIASLIGQPLSDDFEPEYRKRSFEAFKKEIKPIKGVSEVIENLKIPFCVASSGPENKIRLNLNATGLLSHFEDKIFSCFTIQKWKPEPDVYLWAAETMGFKPNECLVIEDSISGVKGAKRGGFDVYGYTEHDYNNELELESDRTFNNMNELLNLINI